MAKENITLEELAQMVARGFENAPTKADLEQLAKKADLVASKRNHARIHGNSIITSFGHV